MTTATSNGHTTDYNPREHLVTVSTKQGPKPYLPAAYRLYELNLKYENANFASEVIYMNEETNFVIVKCRLYLGSNYEQSDKKAEAMKQGKLSELDKVETAAKARCARDFGVSTEFALDFEEATEEPPRMATEEQLDRIAAYRKSLQREPLTDELTFEQANQELRSLVEEYNNRKQKAS